MPALLRRLPISWPRFPATPSDRWWILALVLFTALPFTGALVQEYGYFDDYSLKMRVASGAWDTFDNEFYLDGRPLFGALVGVLYGGPPDIASLWIPRAFGLLGIVLFALLLFCHARTAAGLRAPLAAAWALIGTLQPAWAVFGFWATVGPIAWSFLLGYAAGVFLDRAASHRASGIAGLLVCGTVSMGIYQMGVGMLVVAYLLPRFANPGMTPPRTAWHPTVLPGAVLATFYAVYFALYKTLLASGVIPGNRQDRSQLGESVVQWAERILQFSLPTALQGWARIFEAPLAWALTGILALLLFLPLVGRFRAEPRKTALLLVGWLGCLGLLCAPLMTSAAVWAHYRVLPAIGLLQLLPLLAWVPLASGFRRPGLILAGFSLGAAGCVVATTYAVSLQRVPQLAGEWRSIREAVSKTLPKVTPLVTVVPPPGAFPRHPTWQLPGEFHLRSVKSDWVLQSMLVLAWAEVEGGGPLNPLSTAEIRVEVVEALEIEPGAFIPRPILLLADEVDLSAIPPRPPTPATTVLQGLGPVHDLGDGRYYSDTFGLIKSAGAHWFHLARLGWIHLSAPRETGFEAWSKRLQWIVWDRPRTRLHPRGSDQPWPRDARGIFAPAQVTTPQVED